MEPDAGLLGLADCVTATFSGPFEPGLALKAKLTMTIQPEDVGAEVQLIRAVGLAARKEATPEDRKEAAACVQRAKDKGARVADGDGLNRTGMALSVHADEMRETAAQFQPQGAEREFRAFRQKGREGHHQ